MFRIGLIFIFGISTVCFTGCDQNSEPEVKNTPVKEEAEKPVIKKIEFVVPADSLITEVQMKSWFACNQLLDSIAILYADSFKIDDPQKRIRYQDDFSAAQDKICVMSGLPGGYKEYRWIMENMGSPRNKDVVEKSNATIF